MNERKFPQKLINVITALVGVMVFQYFSFVHIVKYVTMKIKQYAAEFKILFSFYVSFGLPVCCLCLLKKFMQLSQCPVQINSQAKHPINSASVLSQVNQAESVVFF